MNPSSLFLISPHVVWQRIISAHTIKAFVCATTSSGVYLTRSGWEFKCDDCHEPVLHAARQQTQLIVRPSVSYIRGYEYNDHFLWNENHMAESL